MSHDYFPCIRDCGTHVRHPQVVCSSCLVKDSVQADLVRGPKDLVNTETIVGANAWVPKGVVAVRTHGYAIHLYLAPFVHPAGAPLHLNLAKEIRDALSKAIAHVESLESPYADGRKT